MALHNNVFKDQIWEWFCNDLESCLLVSTKVQAGSSEFKGGLNFPACMTIFSVLEMMSGYYSGSATDDNLTNRAVDFLAQYFSPHDSLFQERDFAKKFYSVFRHGLAHQWAPKAGAVSMDFGKQELLLWVGEPTEKYPCLNVPVFFELTKKALEDYEHDLDQYEVLREKFRTRYDAMVATDLAEMQQLKLKLGW